MKNKIPFYCPECHKQTSTTIHKDGIFADPHQPCFQCDECQTFWRITLAYCGKDVANAT